MKNNISEKDILIDFVSNQLWYDRIRLSSPVEVDKVINDFSERFASDGSLVNVEKILRYTDLVRIAGSAAVQDLKRFFGQLENDLDLSSLSFDELRELTFIIESFPYSEKTMVDGFNISALLEREIELIRFDEIKRG